MAHSIRIARPSAAPVHSVHLGPVAHPVRVARTRVAPASEESSSVSTRPPAAPHPSPRRPGRAVHGRRWRGRGRRAQVSAIVTILGLLLVVSFVANYLATSLPHQMSVNDGIHELQVENQLGHLAAVLERASHDNVIDTPVTQPISLGSQGVPPFAAPDGGSIGGIAGQGPASINLGLFGSMYGPPTGTGRNNPTYLDECTVSDLNTSWKCQGGVTVVWNFTNQNSIISFDFRAQGGATVVLNFATSNSSIYVNATGAPGNAQPVGNQIIGIYGSHDNAYIDGTGDATQKIAVVGNYDNVTIVATSRATVDVLMVGDHDNVTFRLSNGNSNTIKVNGWGTNLTVTPGKGGDYSVNYTGFSPNKPKSPLCPYDNLVFSDYVNRFPHQAQGSGRVLLNYTEPPPVNGTEWPFSAWQITDNIPAPYVCIFFAQFNATTAGALRPATFVVHLANRYAPPVEIAFDQGAVIYAQPGGIPFMVDPPPVTATGGFATVWVPALDNKVGAESGTGTVALTLRQMVVQRYTFPGGGWQIDPSRPLTLVYHTPYYMAWLNHFCEDTSFTSSGASVSLTFDNPNGSGNQSWGCDQSRNPWNFTQVYQSGGPIGQVVLRIPVTSVAVRLAVFSISV